MEDDPDAALNPQSYSTVDPEVRAYVYSLVSAVWPLIVETSPILTQVYDSLAGLALTKMVGIYLVMTP